MSSLFGEFAHLLASVAGKDKTTCLGRRRGAACDESKWVVECYAGIGAMRQRMQHVRLTGIPERNLFSVWR